VSFPSAPPNGDRLTPPYGTPVYDPLTATAVESEPRRAYRIAPPDDRTALREARPAEPVTTGEPPKSPDRPAASDRAKAADAPAPAFTMGDAPKPSAQPVASAAPAPDPRTTTLASRGQRRVSRPVLAAVPYPAPPSSAPAQPAENVSSPPGRGGEAAEWRKVRAPDGGPVLEGLRKATARDEVIRLAMRGMRLVARRLAVFLVKRDGFYGWACNADLGDEETLRTLVISADLPSVLATATATAMYLGPIPPTPAHEGLLRVMERSSLDVAAVAVRVAGRPVLVLLCDDLHDTMVSTRYLTELAKGVGEALTRLITR
jgi:hypothetical protein